MIAGGLLQDPEEHLRRSLAPIEERVRPGAKTRGLPGGPRTGGAADGGASPGPGLADGPPVIVLPSDPPNRPGGAEPGTPDEDHA